MALIQVLDVGMFTHVRTNKRQIFILLVKIEATARRCENCFQFITREFLLELSSDVIHRSQAKKEK